MPIFSSLGLIFNPNKGWQAIKDRQYGAFLIFFVHTLPFALIAPICGFYGTTRTGWQLGTSAPMKLTSESALQISILYFFAMLVATLSVAWALYWMSKTYDAKEDFASGLALASFTATPLFLVGFVQLRPELWLNLLAGLPALAMSVALFYNGVPVMLEISKERSFLFATAMLGFGLVALVAMIIVTVLLWGAGFAPELTH